MPYESPFDRAGREAKARGACPVTLFDEFFTDHWAFDDLCADFECPACVATDEDLWFLFCGPD